MRLAHDSILYAARATYAIARTSVCLSHGWISQKPWKLHVGLRNFHPTVAPFL